MFLRVDDSTDLGYGQHLLTAWSNMDSWLRTVTPESQSVRIDDHLAVEAFSGPRGRV